MLQPDLRVSKDELLSIYDPLREEMSGLEPLNAYYLGLWNHYLADDILTKVDRASSAHGLEVRVPLLDHRIVELAGTIPPEMKYCDGEPKNILRQVAAKYAPVGQPDTPKRGFGLPQTLLQNQFIQNKLDAYSSAPKISQFLRLNDRSGWSSLLTWKVFVAAVWLDGAGL